MRPSAEGSGAAPSALHVAVLSYATLDDLIASEIATRLQLRGGAGGDAAPTSQAVGAAGRSRRSKGGGGNGGALRGPPPASDLLLTISAMDSLTQKIVEAPTSSSSAARRASSGSSSQRGRSSRYLSSEEFVSGECTEDESDEAELSSYCGDSEGQTPFALAIRALASSGGGAPAVASSSTTARGAAATVDDTRSVDGAGGAYNPHLYSERQAPRAAKRSGAAAVRGVDRHRDFLLHSFPPRIDVAVPTMADKPTLSRHHSCSSINSMMSSMSTSSGGGAAPAAGAPLRSNSGEIDTGLLGGDGDGDDDCALGESCDLEASWASGGQRGVGRSTTSSPFSQHSAFRDVSLVSARAAGG